MRGCVQKVAIHLLFNIKKHSNVKSVRRRRSENRIFLSLRKIVRKNRIFTSSAQHIVFQQVVLWTSLKRSKKTVIHNERFDRSI